MLQPGSLVCVSSGQPPMPAALAGAVCGPRVPGTQRPSNCADLKSLNPCQLNECVSHSMTLDAWLRLIALCSVSHMANAVLPPNIARHLRLQVQHILRVNLSPPRNPPILRLSICLPPLTQRHRKLVSLNRQVPRGIGLCIPSTRAPLYI